MAAAAVSVVARRQYLDELAREGQVSGHIRKTVTTDLPPEGTGFWKCQRKAAIAYIQMKVQLSVAALIAGNFVANVIEKWIDPAAERYAAVWDLVDMFFNCMFTIELAWNMYAFWFWRFWRSGWNIFDFVVVTIGILNMTRIPLPGPFGLLRMMRAFRVFRLFKRVRSLNAIMVSLARAVPGVSNAFVVLLLVMSIYAIVGQEFFMYHASNYTYTNDIGDEVDLVTPRGLDYGYDYWGNFGLALYTMFQVLTTESWSEAVGRPLLNSNDDFQQLGVAVFFGSYNLLVGIVLINVVVAVLLEKMMAQKEGENMRNEMHKTLSEAPSERSSIRRASAASSSSRTDAMKGSSHAAATAAPSAPQPFGLLRGDAAAAAECAWDSLQNQPHTPQHQNEVPSHTLKELFMSPRDTAVGTGTLSTDVLKSTIPGHLDGSVSGSATTREPSKGAACLDERSAEVLEIEADCAKLKSQLAMACCPATSHAVADIDALHGQSGDPWKHLVEAWISFHLEVKAVSEERVGSFSAIVCLDWPTYLDVIQSFVLDFSSLCDREIPEKNETADSMDADSKAYEAELKDLLEKKEAAKAEEDFDKAEQLKEQVQQVKSNELARLKVKKDEALKQENYLEVFSQWTSFLELIERALDAARIQHRRFDGSLSIDERAQRVAWLSEPAVGGNGARVLLAGLKSGGTGLNLVAASRLYLLDLWWNPAVEEQAIQRVHRIGQKQEVHVYKFVVEDTIDLDLLQLHRAKERLLEDALSGGKSHETATRLTMDDLKRWQLSKDHELLPRTTRFDARPFQPMPIPPDGRLINGKFEYAFFTDRNPKFVETLGKFLEKETFEKDDFIIREGDKGYSMYFFCSGSAIMCTGADFHEVQILTRGDQCGELALLGITHRSCSVVARERTECLVLKKRFFQAVVERFPEEKEYFAQVAAVRKQELKLNYDSERSARHRNRRLSRHGNKEAEGDSDRDATDDPAPSLPEADTSSPLPDAEIPGQAPALSHLSVKQLLAPPPRQGPLQLAPLGQEQQRVRNGRRGFQHRMAKELTTVGHAALARKMEVAAALHEEMQPPSSSSLIPTRRAARSHSLTQVPALERLKPQRKEAEDLPQLPCQPAHARDFPPVKGSVSKVEIEYEDPPPAKKVLQDDDDDDDGFDFLNMDLNAIDPWARAVSA
ncbi:unnamed protein product [Symbiodinium pilosum]|uniref:Uncharacterized protein n=1 Tax=Symbiodinium pilosum TaxID=2952 RepID=A0A812TMY0_SYMPI|nr:unnamed protein product [Symbiodinium pilosum]